MGKHCNRPFGQTKTGACFYSGRDRLRQGKAKLLSRVFFFSNRFDDFRGERGQAEQRGKGAPRKQGSRSNTTVAGRGSERSLITRDSCETTMTDGLNKRWDQVFYLLCLWCDSAGCPGLLVKSVTLCSRCPPSQITLLSWKRGLHNSMKL